jgi:transposase
LQDIDYQRIESLHVEQLADIQLFNIFVKKEIGMPKFKDYKQGQQASLFPLDISALVPEKHLVRQIDKVIDRIETGKLQVAFSENGASSYHPKMMLKVIVYAYSTKNYSSRTIAAMLRQDVTYMWLSGLQTPDFNTVNRFRSVYLKDVIEDVFSEVLIFLHEHKFIKFESYFVDGTKLEADAGKYTHVWKSNTERYKAAVQARVKTLMTEIEQLNDSEDKLYDKKDFPELGEQSQINSKQVEELAQNISRKLEEKQTGLKKNETRKIRGKITKLIKEKENLEKYEEQEAILGDRNSYSKTDNDASMMRMKGTDELRPGYNVIVSSENQFVTNTSVGQNASDSVCFPEHLSKNINRGEKFVPDNFVGDAGFGSEENYEALEGEDIKNYLKFQSFHQESQKKHKKNIFHKDNFEYKGNEDFYTCPSKMKLVHKETIKKKTINGYTQTIKVYEAENCEVCPLKAQCTKAKGNRTIQVNPNLERHKEIARENLNSEQGIEFRKRRGWEIETFFGDIKHNQKYKRIRLRGLEKAELEINWLAISYNLRKAHQKLIKKAA